ncbi:hypothetical protein F6P88_08760 [Streptococcus suis]|nr:hypothetical protein [Streptococcus suis]MBS8114464.1 hypothetical protein [Streptococcus suis]
MIRPDLECKTRTNLPINHCAEMLTLTLRSGAGLEPSLLNTIELSILLKQLTFALSAVANHLYTLSRM